MAAGNGFRGDKEAIAKPQATVGLVAQALSTARDTGGGCLVLGAGASVSAGIPTAAGLVDLVRQRFPESYLLAQAATGVAAPSSHTVLRHLSLGERDRLIGDALAGARLNWEHIIVAELMAQGYVGLVLTVNFDTLTVAACARANVSPAVYDLAGDSDVPVAAVAGGPAIVHLHGLRERLVPLATEEDRARQRRRIDPLIRHVLYRGMPIVVLGYSGNEDGTMEILASHERFTNRLFWVSHLDRPLSRPARGLLDAPDNDALLVPGYDAEGFMIALAQKLGAFPPRFVANPYAETVRAWEAIMPPGDAAAAAPFDAALVRLLREAESIGAGQPAESTATPRSEAPSTAAKEPPPAATPVETPPPAPAKEPSPAATSAAKEPPWVAEPAAAPRLREPVAAPAAAAPRIEAAPNRAASPAPAESPAAKADHEATPQLRLVVGDYQRLVDDYSAGRVAGDENRDAVAWAYVMLANEDANHAQSRSGSEAEELWAAAETKYRSALRVCPGHADAFYNWASAVAAQAHSRHGAEAARLWATAVSKYEAALSHRPNDAEALADCARALVGQARWTAAPESDRLIDKALDKLERAFRLGDETAYVGYLEVALAHARHREIGRFLEHRPARLTDPARFALSLVYLIFALEQEQAIDLAPFDELPRRTEPPCRDWDFADIEPAIARLQVRDSEFVHAVIALLQGDRPMAHWRTARDSWLAGRSAYGHARPSVTSAQ
jgi:tetratricopeptide (TPR) repeat protein